MTAADRGAPAGAGAGVLLLTAVVLAALVEAVAGTVLGLGRNDILGDVHATADEFALLDVAYTALKLVGFLVAPALVSRTPPLVLTAAAVLLLGAACGLAGATSNLGALIVLRLVQGLLGGVLLVSAQTLLFLAFAPGRQPFVQALFAVGAVVAPATLAPALTGWLVDTLSWSWIFLGLAPLGLASAGLLLLSPISPRPDGRPLRIDHWSLGALAPGLVGLTYVLTQGSRWDWFEAGRIVWLTAGSAVLLAVYALRQGRAAGTLLDLGVFRTADFSFAFVVSFVAGAALFGSAYLIPAFALSVLAFTPTDAGALLLAGAPWFVAALFLAAALIQFRRLPPVATVPLGILLLMSAMWMLSRSAGESGTRDLQPAIVVRGLGLGFLFLSITLIAFLRLPQAGLATGIGLFNAGRQLGGLIGVAGLQTLIDHESVVARTGMAANLPAGDPEAAARLATTTAALVARGLDPAAAPQAAAALLHRAVAAQSAVVAFDAAFLALALLFVAAVPVMVAVKASLSRTAKARHT